MKQNFKIYTYSNKKIRIKSASLSPLFVMSSLIVYWPGKCKKIRFLKNWKGLERSIKKSLDSRGVMSIKSARERAWNSQNQINAISPGDGDIYGICIHVYYMYKWIIIMVIMFVIYQIVYIIYKHIILYIKCIQYIHLYYILYIHLLFVYVITTIAYCFYWHC